MEDCLFCKIVRKEIPAFIVYETEGVIAFKDINPKAPIHDLVIPKKHIESLNDVKPEDKELIAKVLLALKEVAKKENIYMRGYRVIANTGKEGGQLIPHLHFHILGGKDLGPKIVFE